MGPGFRRDDSGDLVISGCPASTAGQGIAALAIVASQHPRHAPKPAPGNGNHPMSAILLAQQILNGLLDGVYYLLIALGLSLIFSLGGIVNLAHGAFFAIGAYLTLVVSPYIGFSGAFVVAPVSV